MTLSLTIHRYEGLLVTKRYQIELNALECSWFAEVLATNWERLSRDQRKSLRKSDLYDLYLYLKEMASTQKPTTLHVDMRGYHD